MEFPEHELRAAPSRIGVVRVASGTQQRAQLLVILAQELCEASQATCEASLEVRQESRRIRKQVYRRRLIGGAT